MTMFRKVAISLAAVSLAAAPLAASAQESARATSFVEDGSDLEGSSSWIIGLVGLLAGVVAIALVIDNDEDSPVSP